MRIDEDDGDFDDLPETHLDDDEYEAFVAREFDDGGAPRGDPRVGWIILMTVLALLAAAALLLA